MKISKTIMEEIITPENSLGITRDEMPQIDGKDIPAFLKHVKNSDRDYEKCSIPAKDLKPSQSELDTDKAADIWKNDKAHEHPIVVSQDNYVLDGHHRWLAVQQNEPESEMKCIKLGDNAKPALELMHNFKKVKVRDIEDNLVESIFKIIEELGPIALPASISQHLHNLDYTEINAVEVDEDLEDQTTTVIFTDEDGNELVAVFFTDEELGPVVTVVEHEFETEDDEHEVIQLHGAVVKEDGLIDFAGDLSWLDEETLESIFTWDESDDEDDSWITDSDDSIEDIEERTVTVIRGGKKVRKKIVRKKRKKRLSAKRKAGIRKAVKKRRVKRVQTQRKRKRSLKIRKRAKLKRKPKNLRVVG